MASQNTRALPTYIKLLRTSVTAIGSVLPGLAARYVYRVWIGTRRFPTPQRETHWLASAWRHVVLCNDLPVAVYEWGEGPIVMLVHGWNGRGSQLGAIAEKLALAGYKAVAVDLPAHGQTPGSRTDAIVMSEAIRCVLRHYDDDLHGFVSHSFGVFPIAMLLRQGLAPKCVVSFCPPHNMLYLTKGFTDLLNLSPPVIQRFYRLIENNYGHDIWDKVSAELNAAHVQTPALIIHDKNDRIVGIDAGVALAEAWQGSRMIKTTGLGHQRILSNRETIKQVVSFMDEFRD